MFAHAFVLDRIDFLGHFARIVEVILERFVVLILLLAYSSGVASLARHLKERTFIPIKQKTVHAFYPSLLSSSRTGLELPGGEIEVEFSSM